MIIYPRGGTTDVCIQCKRIITYVVLLGQGEWQIMGVWRCASNPATEYPRHTPTKPENRERRA